MANLPAPIREFIEALTDELLAPGYLLVNEQDALVDWGGALDSYGITGLEAKMQVMDQFAFLAGVLPVDAGGVFLPNVVTRKDVYADIYFFHRTQGTWILFLDATANVQKRRALQQRAYDVSLQAADLEQEGKALYDVNTMLEQRVREQTAELSQTVRRLQQELAETKRTERALSASESRFRSLFDSNLVGVLSWDAHGTITEANDTFLRLVGYSKDDLSQGLVSWTRISPSGPPTVSASREPRSSAETQANHPAERELIRKDGRQVMTLFVVSPGDTTNEKNIGFATPLA